MKVKYEYRNGCHGARISLKKKSGESFFIYKEEIPDLIMRLKNKKNSPDGQTWSGEEDSVLSLENGTENGWLLIKRDGPFLREMLTIPETGIPEFSAQLEKAVVLTQKKERSLRDSRRFIKTPLGYLFFLLALLLLSAGFLQVLRIQAQPEMAYNGEPVQIGGEIQIISLNFRPLEKRKDLTAEIILDKKTVLSPVALTLSKEFSYESDFIPLNNGGSVFFTFSEKNKAWEEVVGGKRPKRQHLYILTTVTMDGEEPPTALFAPERKEDFQKWYGEHSTKRDYYFILTAESRRESK